jgi:hypothetical protein
MNGKPLVKIIWNDAHGSAGMSYQEHEIPHQTIQIETVGWLLREDAIGVSVANEHCGDGAWRGVTFVPAGMLVGRPLLVAPATATRRRRTPRTPPPAAAPPSEPADPAGQ